MTKSPTPKESPEVVSELSKVATNPKQNFAILIIGAILLAYVIYTFLLKSDEQDKAQDEAVPIPKNISKPVSNDVDEYIPQIPKLPDPPKIEAPVIEKDLPAAAPELPSVNSSENTTSIPSLPFEEKESDQPPIDLNVNLPANTETQAAIKKRVDTKRKSSIVLVAGELPTKTPEELQQAADFKQRGDMNYVLGRGKMLDAVIESAINTDFGGEIRGVIVKDVYAQTGKNILIPKGSKIFGAYTTGTDGAYGRVSIAWNKIDLVNGYSINFAGLAVDDLSRSGVSGRVDNKVKERLTNAVLKSAFDVALASALDKLIKPAITTEGSANLSTQASSIRNIANNSQVTPPNTAQNVFDSVCANVKNSITDKASITFTTIDGACNSLAQDATLTGQQRLDSIKVQINTAADQLLQTSSAQKEPTKKQIASDQAFTDISDKMKEFVEEQEFKPTITIDQGTRIKVYVNRDYQFPKNAVSKNKVY